MSGGTVDLTALDAIVKELYPTGVPEDLALKKHTFAREVRKQDGFTGDQMVVPMLYDFPGGRSASIASLLAASGPIGASKQIKMNVTRVKDYAATWLDSEMLLATGDDKGSFVRGRQYEIDNMMKALGNSIGHAIYRSGSGSLGTVSATPTGVAYFTFTNRSDAKHVRVGTQLQFALAETTGSLLDNGDFVTVTAVDESTGKVTTDATDLTVSITGLVATAHVFYLGDRNAKLKGLSAWIPLTAPVAGSDSFFGADRGVQPNRLAGVRLNQPNYPIEDLILEVGETINEQGGDPSVCYISHRRWINLAKRLNAKVEYSNGGGTMASMGGSFPVYLSSGMIQVKPDSDCPDNLGYVLTMDSWCVHHLGGLPKIVDDDGNVALRRTAEDSIEIRARYYAQLVCYAPGHNGVFALPSG